MSGLWRRGWQRGGRKRGGGEGSQRARENKRKLTKKPRRALVGCGAVRNRERRLERTWRSGLERCEGQRGRGKGSRTREREEEESRRPTLS